MQQAHIFISGYVQGVGFRHFVRQRARKKGLTGWVRNLPDGRVEAVIQGEKEQIEHLIKDVRKGPMLAKVRQIEATWEEVRQPFSEFSLQHIA